MIFEELLKRDKGVAVVRGGYVTEQVCFNDMNGMCNNNLLFDLKGIFVQNQYLKAVTKSWS